MGLLIEKLVKDPKKKLIYDWIKTILVVSIFLIVIGYIMFNSSYIQGYEDCRRFVAKQLGVFPSMNLSDVNSTMELLFNSTNLISPT